MARPTVVIPPGSDFRIPPVPGTKQTVLLFGDAGVGKTTFPLKYAPDPIAFFSYDHRGVYAARQAHEAGRRILFTQIEFPADVSRLDDKKVREYGHAAIAKTMKNLDIAVKSSQEAVNPVRTIVLDTGTEYGDMVTAAFRGRADKVKDYGDSKNLINQSIRRLCERAREGNASLIIIARPKAVWENNAPTGKLAYRCSDVFHELADWEALIRLKPRKSVKLKQDMEIELVVTKPGLDWDQMDEVYTAEQWDKCRMNPYVYASCLNYPGSSPEDWA